MRRGEWGFTDQNTGIQLCLSQEAPGSAPPLLSSSPVPSPGGASTEWEYPGHPWHEYSGPGRQSEERGVTSPVSG